MTDMINSRTGVAAGIGAVVGFVFAGPLGAGVGALIGGGVARASGTPDRGVMTPRRKVIYSRAMNAVKDPEELNKLADAFAGEGLTTEAATLRKRAELRAMPEAKKEKRRIFFRKAMASDDVKTIREVADGFEKEGSFDAARALRDHADAVAAAHQAGKSAKPMTSQAVDVFVDKLGKAIVHFGPASKQAQMAAATLIQARGKAPTPELVAEVINVTAQALHLDAPAAGAHPAGPIEIPVEGEGDAPAADAPLEAAPVPEGVVEVAAAAVEPTGDAPPEPPPVVEQPPPGGAKEPTVVGPPAGTLEPQVAGEPR